MARDSFSSGKPSNWVKVTEHAAWEPRDSQGEVVFKDKMWIFGGWFDSYQPAPRDVWSLYLPEGWPGTD